MDHYCIMEKFLKNREKIKTWRTIYPKNQEKFKNSKPSVQSYKGECTQQKEGNHYSVIKGLLYRSGDTACFFRVRVLLFTK